VNGMRRWMDAIWPLALLVVFVGAFRKTSLDSTIGQTPAACDDAYTADLGTLEACLALDPRNVELMAAAGDRHAASGANERAESTYRRALALDPRHGDVHVRLGELLLRRGDSAGARAAGEAALKSQPGSLAAERLIERAAVAERQRVVDPAAGRDR
jgi:Flp pilus assembly protein TadD